MTFIIYKYSITKTLLTLSLLITLRAPNSFTKFFLTINYINIIIKILNSYNYLFPYYIKILSLQELCYNHKFLNHLTILKMINNFRILLLIYLILVQL